MKRLTFAMLFFVIGGLMLCQPDSYSQPDGETLFYSKCGVCHAEGRKAPAFAPVKYASIQWEKFFKRNKHRKKEDISKVVSQTEIDLIKKYLKDHAADSDIPIAAGIK